jgi:Ser/Thr protein kinase RdoA (MazF antagonist)
MRALAETALDAYGLTGARLKFLYYNGNVIYRVDGSHRTSIGKSGGPYVANRYVLRVHMDYHTYEAIRSELQWLMALRRDADLLVPEPVPTRDGELLLEAGAPGVPGRRKCSLLRWLGGRFIPKGLRPGHASAWGRLMAHLHEHAVGWRLPDGFTRRQRDWSGLFGEDAGFEFPAGELWEAIPKRFQEPFEIVTRELKQVMDELGRGPDVYGLVHADLDVNTNVLFSRGEARAIDFDDSAFAYWIHDLAFALSPWQGTAEQRWVQDAMLEGYTDVRSIPRSQLAHLDLFMAAFNANLMLWMIDWAKLRPQSSEPAKHVNKYGSNLLRYFDSR